MKVYEIWKNLELKRRVKTKSTAIRIAERIGGEVIEWDLDENGNGGGDVIFPEE